MSDIVRITQPGPYYGKQMLISRARSLGLIADDGSDIIPTSANAVIETGDQVVQSGDANQAVARRGRPKGSVNRPKPSDDPINDIPVDQPTGPKPNIVLVPQNVDHAGIPITDEPTLDAIAEATAAIEAAEQA